MGSENISFLRPYFDGSDYPHWKFKMELYLVVILLNFGILFVKIGNHPKPRLMALKPKLIETIGVPFNKKAITKTERL